MPATHSKSVASAVAKLKKIGGPYTISDLAAALHANPKVARAKVRRTPGMPKAQNNRYHLSPKQLTRVAEVIKGH